MNIINRRTVGSEKEELAACYLIEHGYTILERNFRAKNSELDIIAKDNDYIVFAEVKYRRNAEYGYPEEAVNKKKQQLIISAALFYMYRNNLSVDIPYRFDVIVICGDELRHIKNAF